MNSILVIFYTYFVFGRRQTLTDALVHCGRGNSTSLANSKQTLKMVKIEKLACTGFYLGWHNVAKKYLNEHSYLLLGAK